jgi:uncharacterized protein (DUF433 family)
MLLEANTEPIPIWEDEHGRLRVGSTRVLLDLVVYAYWRGETPETITASYPTLSLDDVYLAIGYYLRHRDEIDAYLRQQEAEAQAAQREHEAAHPRTLTREVLMARMEVKRRSSAS